MDVRLCELRLVVRESAKDLRRELEVAIAGDAPHPTLRVGGRGDPVEGRVDLDGVEEGGQIGEWIELRAVGGIHGPFPIGVAPASRSDTQRMSHPSEAGTPAMESSLARAKAGAQRARRGRQHLDIFILTARKRLRTLEIYAKSSPNGYKGMFSIEQQVRSLGTFCIRHRKGVDRSVSS